MPSKSHFIGIIVNIEQGRRKERVSGDSLLTLFLARRSPIDE